MTQGGILSAFSNSQIQNLHYEAIGPDSEIAILFQLIEYEFQIETMIKFR